MRILFSARLIFVFYLSFICVEQVSASEEIKLSNQARFSILTCSSGSDSYTAFGHSGIRVIDTFHQFDVVFNFGAFNSSIGSFYIDFLKHKPTFFLAIVPTLYFLDEYRTEQRSITETVLTLTLFEKKKLFSDLMLNAEPHNSAYQYDFVKNNCTTKIVDILNRNLGIQFHCENTITHKSYKQRLRNNLVERPYLDLVIAILLGEKLDSTDSQSSKPFLPTELHFAIRSTSNKGVKLGGEDIVLLQSSSFADKQLDSSPPNLIITLLFIALLITYFFKNKALHQWLGCFLLAILSSIGMLLLYLWLGTDNDSTYKNYNLLWALPIHLIAIAVIFLAKPSILATYFQYVGIYMMALPIAYFVIPQTIYVGIYFWTFLLGVYFYTASFRLSK